MNVISSDLPGVRFANWVAYIKIPLDELKGILAALYDPRKRLLNVISFSLLFVLVNTIVGVHLVEMNMLTPGAARTEIVLTTLLTIPTFLTEQVVTRFYQNDF
jgi:hypothetical protein